MDTRQIVEQLGSPAAYRARLGEIGDVGFLQTHISLLFFAGDRVYKVKKPVELGFLDFTTLARRLHFCEEEVRLNRRLAPDVYLGVVPVVRGGDGRLCIGGEGEAVEWAVEMRRLPESGMLSARLDRGEVDNGLMNALAELLVDFHAAAPAGEGVDEHGSPAAIRANVEQNFEQLEPFVEGTVGIAGGAVLSRAQLAFLRERAARFLDRERGLLERRVAEGRIREGHGDLHSGNICTTPGGIVVYDCIEFNAALRCGDVAADLAFLAMDLDQRGFPGFAGYLVKRYTGPANDPELGRVTPFYKSYRAIVRGKVAAMSASNPALEPKAAEDLRREAMRYVQLAAAYDLPPILVLMCGLPASGKSWLAERLAVPLRAVLARSDIRRKTLAGLPPTEHVRPGYGSGLYTPEMKARTYRSLLDDAVEGLSAGRSVVVDATFSQRSWRQAFVDAATRLEKPFCLIHVSASEDRTRERLAGRENDPGAVSDAGVEVYERARQAFEPPDELERGRVIEVTSGDGVPEHETSLAIDGMIHLARSVEGAR